MGKTKYKQNCFAILNSDQFLKLDNDSAKKIEEKSQRILGR